MSEQMPWMKYAEGVTPSRTDDALKKSLQEMSSQHSSGVYAHVDMPYVAPQVAMRATLVESDMDKIRQIVKDEVHKALLLDAEDQHEWEQTFSTPHVRDSLRRRAEEARDESRVEPHIVTVQGSERDFGVALHKLTTDAGTSAQELEEISRKMLLMAALPPPSLTVTCTHMERKYRGIIHLVEETGK